MKSHKAFTLVELIVLIGVLIALVSLILAVSGNLMERSKQVGCVANLTSIGQAVAYYTSENNGYLPPGYVSLDDGTRSTWFAGIAPFIERTSGAKPTNNATDVRYCPATSINGTDIYKRDRATWRTDYACNSRLMIGSQGAEVQRLKRTAFSGNAVLAYDGLQSGTETKPNAHARHRDQINVLFLDGHVETVKEMPTNSSAWRPLP